VGDSGDSRQARAADAPQSLCSTCYKSIDPRARKCTECGSFQDWRRHLSIGSSVLALLVALVSVTALAVPMIKSTFGTENSDMHFTIQGVMQNQIYVMISNTGTRPGSVNDMSLSLRNFVVRAGLSISPLLIRPGEARQIVVPIPPPVREAIDRGFITARAAGEAPDVENVTITYTNFANSASQTFIYDLPLKDLVRAGGTAWHECATRPTYKVTNFANNETVEIGTNLKSCADRPPYIDDEAFESNSVAIYYGKQLERVRNSSRR
jgi:hypothetical protein